MLRLLGLCCQQAWLCKFLLSSGFRFMLELSGQAGVLGMDPELFSYLPHSVPQSFAELKSIKSCGSAAHTQIVLLLRSVKAAAPLPWWQMAVGL